MRTTCAGRLARPARFVKAAGVAIAGLGLAFLPLPNSVAGAQSGLVAAAAAASAPGHSVHDFYRARGGRPLWFAPANAGAAEELVALLASADADGLNPKRYRIRDLQRAIRSARSNPAAAGRAETLLSQALVAYVRDLKRPSPVGYIFVDRELAPAPPSPRALLEQAEASPSLAAWVANMGWMHPFYADLRRAYVQRLWGSEQQRQLLQLNLERARALPGGPRKHVLVNAAAQRLYMFENGKPVDMMRVVVGRPKHATPMMIAFMRYTALNPFWNVPPDLAAERVAPNVLKEGLRYLRERGYQVLSDWTDNAKVVDPASVDWQAVADGRVEVRLRQLPGPHNSMGRMKFMFPNSQGVYLHDTPEKELLSEASRLFSGGCVRLEDAARLARWLYGKPLNSKGAKPEQKVPLPAPVPVALTYLTVMPSGSQLAYYDDIYGRDAAQLGGIRSAALR